MRAPSNTSVWPSLTVQGRHVGVEVFRIKLGNVPADDVGHRVDLAVAFADRFHRVGIIPDLGFLKSAERSRRGSFVLGDELKDLAVQLVLSLGGLFG